MARTYEVDVEHDVELPADGYQVNTGAVRDWAVTAGSGRHGSSPEYTVDLRGTDAEALINDAGAFGYGIEITVEGLARSTSRLRSEGTCTEHIALDALDWQPGYDLSGNRLKVGQLPSDERVLDYMQQASDGGVSDVYAISAEIVDSAGNTLQTPPSAGGDPITADRALFAGPDEIDTREGVKNFGESAQDVYDEVQDKGARRTVLERVLDDLF